MITTPSRVSQLIQQLEAGEPVTPEQVRRIATLQALDLAKAGEDFAREACQNDAAMTNRLAAVMEIEL